MNNITSHLFVANLAQCFLVSCHFYPFTKLDDHVMAAISIAFHIRLRRDLENCLYIDGWCAPDVHTGTRAHIIQLRI